MEEDGFLAVELELAMTDITPSQSQLCGVCV